MNDTDPAIAAMIHSRMMALSGEERFMLGIRMCEAARRMVLASLPADLPPAERKRLLYERYYGELLPADFPLERRLWKRLLERKLPVVELRIFPGGRCVKKTGATMPPVPSSLTCSFATQNVTTLRPACTAAVASSSNG